jgi:hypothetical protein
MILIANKINGHYLDDILLSAPAEMECVKAAIAYASGSPRLIDFCVDRKIPLQFWGRLDETIPISINILKRFLSLGPSYNCKLVYQFYHPKVIWFAGYGAYIGSANLTERAWFKNVEAGIWFSQADLEKSNLIPELENLFHEIDQISEQLSEELYNRLKTIDENYSFIKSELTLQQKARLADFDKNITPTLSKNFEGLSQVSKKDASMARKRKFFEEWNETLQLLRKISEEVILDANRPNWVQSSVPKGVQVDQFLHAYYYTHIKTGNRSLHQEYHEKNKSNPQAALNDALVWWHGLAAAPSDEDGFMYERAPFLLEKLSRNNILGWSEDDFIQVCIRLHAFVTAARQTSNYELNLPENTKLELYERAKKVASWIWKEQAGNGANVVQVLHHILYGGPIDDITERIWQACFTDEWHLPRFGISCVGEIVGWAMPDRYPPRNGRTSKALNSLGFNVKIYSE